MEDIYAGILYSLTKEAFLKNEKQEKMLQEYMKRTGKKRSDLTGTDVAKALGEGKAGMWIAGKLDKVMGTPNPVRKRKSLATRVFGEPPKDAKKIFERIAKEKGKKVEDLKGSDFPLFGKKY